MKKNFLGLAILAVSLVSFSSMAQCPESNTDCQQTCEQQTPCQQGQKGDKAKKHGKCIKGEKKQFNPYEGLTLTDAQKEQLQKLDADRKAAKEAKKQQAKAEKQRKDSTARAARQAEQREYFEQVKAIIGPDQYTLFLENMVINGGGKNMKAPMHNKGMKPNKEKSKGEKGQKGNRPVRGEKPSNK